MKEENLKKKVTLFLDTETLDRLARIAETEMCNSSKSGAVRFLAKEYERKKSTQDN